MLSDIPKPLHTIAGKPMIEWAIDATKEAGIKKTVIVIPEENGDFKKISEQYQTITQKAPLGTGDAVIKAKNTLKNFTGLMLFVLLTLHFLKLKV